MDQMEFERKVKEIMLDTEDEMEKEIIGKLIDLFNNETLCDITNEARARELTKKELKYLDNIRNKLDEIIQKIERFSEEDRSRIARALGERIRNSNIFKSFYDQLDEDERNKFRNWQGDFAKWVFVFQSTILTLMPSRCEGCCKNQRGSCGDKCNG